MKDVQPHYRYTENHEYAAIDGHFLRIGLTDFGQTCFKTIAMVHLPEIGETFKKGQCLCVLESSKAGNEVEAPISGTVVEVNVRLLQKPTLVNDDYYGDGWLVKMEPADPAEWDSLMTAAEYLTEISFFFKKQR